MKFSKNVQSLMISLISAGRRWRQSDVWRGARSGRVLRDTDAVVNVLHQPCQSFETFSFRLTWRVMTYGNFTIIEMQRVYARVLRLSLWNFNSEYNFNQMTSEKAFDLCTSTAGKNTTDTWCKNHYIKSCLQNVLWLKDW